MSKKRREFGWKRELRCRGGYVPKDRFDDASSGLQDDLLDDADEFSAAPVFSASQRELR